MKLSKKSAILLIVSSFVLTYLTLYTATAHNIARHVYNDNSTVVWRSAPSGSFFPWPREPGMLLILSEMSEIDSFIYIYLIKPWVLVGVTMLLWVSVSLYILMLVRVKRNQ